MVYVFQKRYIYNRGKKLIKLRVVNIGLKIKKYGIIEKGEKGQKKVLWGTKVLTISHPSGIVRVTTT